MVIVLVSVLAVTALARAISLARMRRRRSKFIVVAAVIGLVGAVLGAPLANSETAPSRSAAVSASDVAASLGCARRDGWQRWYATPSVTNVNGVWACGWYKSRSYHLEGKVWSTDPDVQGGYLWILWGNSASQAVTASPEGHEFSLDNPVEGTPPRVAECTATSCGEGRRVDYLPERNKLAGVFRVMTYNIHHGFDYRHTEICKGEPTLWKTASTIRRNDPDIVAVNEISKRLLNVGGRKCATDIPRTLADSLEMNYVYCNDYHPDKPSCGSPIVENEWNSGNAIFSRYPIAFRGHRSLPRTSAEAAPRGVIWADVTVNRTRIPVYATHLAASCTVGPPPGCTTEQYEAKKALRQQQLIDILRYMAENGHYPGQTKMIFAGDLNTPDVAGELWRLGHGGRGFNDGFKHISPDWVGNTIPVRESQSETRHRIDYIWTSPLFQHPTRGTAVPWSQSSDHLPVIVDMNQ
jgi:endonuclease/exonuclease/phosphatase family metal-dependent hydrolase